MRARGSLILIVFLLFSGSVHQIRLDKLNSSQLIEHYGFPAEEHSVTSEGYRLTLFRVRGGGPAVLVVHGLASSSDAFLRLGRRSLPLLLAARGYDVWLANVRGNLYSRRHDTLSETDPAFWEFSWHEIGVSDLPAMIDYICAEAAVQKVAYVGHSQATTIAYVMLAERPEYNERLSAVVSLAAVAWMARVASPAVRAMARNRRKIEKIFKTIGFFEIFPLRSPVGALSLLCGWLAPINAICLKLILYPLIGSDYEHVIKEYTDNKQKSLPNGNSLKQILHYLQNVESKLFQKYDYGRSGNLERYGSETAPSYKVENIRTNMLIIYTKNDSLSDFGDVQQLVSNLPNKPELYEVPLGHFSHLDYLEMSSADKLVYRKVIKHLDKFANTVHTVDMQQT